MEDVNLDESVLNRRAGSVWHLLSWTMLTEPPRVRHASFPFISVQLFLQAVEVLCLDLVYRFVIGFSYRLSSSRVTGKAAGLPHSGAVILRKGEGAPPHPTWTPYLLPGVKCRGPRERKVLQWPRKSAWHAVGKQEWWRNFLPFFFFLNRKISVVSISVPKFNAQPLIYWPRILQSEQISMTVSFDLL